MFEIGDTVICIDNSDRTASLIIDGKYIIHKIDTDKDFIRVTYNGGLLSQWFDAERFISLTKYRKQKIKQLKNV